MGLFRGVELDRLTLSGERLTLRPWEPSDAPAVYEIMQDRGMHAYLALPDPYGFEDAEAFVTQFGHEGRGDGSGLGCAMVETTSGLVVGSAALRLPVGPHGDADIGYWVAPAAQGHGYASEATRVLADWGFGHDVHRIELHCDVRNLASARSALSAGFAFEGLRRAHIRVADGTHDLAGFARIADDPGEPIAAKFVPLPPGGLGDGVVTLRATAPADAAAAVVQETDPVTVAAGFHGDAPRPADIARMTARAGLDWLVGDCAPFTIVDVASGSFAGSLRLRQTGPPNIGGLGYAVHPGFRGRGYAARALRLLIPWAFESAGFARLELGAKTDNVASQRAALAAGFEPDGVRVARLRNPDATYSDEARFALVSHRHR